MSDDAFSDEALGISGVPWSENPIHDIKDAILNLSTVLEDTFPDGTLAALSAALREVERDAAVMRKDIDAAIIERMEARSHDKVVGVEGPLLSDRSGDTTGYYTLTRSVSKRRTKVDHAALRRTVASLAEMAEMRLDPETGELRSVEEQTLRMLDEAFRMEPRWGVLSGWGVDDDAFCGETGYANYLSIK